MAPKILFLAGSARKDSLNKKLAKVAYELALEQGADATFIDLRDFPMPIYDGDDEATDGLPENAIKLKQLFIEHSGVFIASPEYNSSFSALLKNSIDWISRPHVEKERPLSAFSDKVAALASTSPGALGGLRGLVPLRMLLGNIQVMVIPEQLAIGGGMTAFDDQGKLTDEKQQRALGLIVARLISETSN
ncbi:NAD(P)H-dependent oxidoreductase [Paraglaciecola mesophila]|uniref:NAD(P)H-dependent oxidoreductase n=1 Tax=Paraglaciecola mesophila TaxID=197222 RepID=A0ABU9SS11_9ALTE|tara:strand:+ start:775 stop:1344 length:570 start_codon:yes stop_codon:yes gene_type:complete